MFHSTDSPIKYSFDCCWPEPLIRFLLARSSVVSELGFNASFVWVRAIYCFLNQSCEPFLKLPARLSIDCPDILNYAESATIQGDRITQYSHQIITLQGQLAICSAISYYFLKFSKPTITDKSGWEDCTTRNQVKIFIYRNWSISRTNTLVFYNIGPGWGGGGGRTKNK